jgi:sugar lactone lactonase YvrE
VRVPNHFAVCLAVAVAAAGTAAADDKKTDAQPIIQFIFGGAPAKPDDKPAADTTHRQVKEIAVKGEVSGNTLQTLCLDADGNVVALVAPGRYGQKPESPVSEVQVYSPAGDLVRKWKVNFLGQSINAGPAGSVLVAGDGQIARFDKTGKTVAAVELPQVAALLKDGEKLRKDAAEQLAEQIKDNDAMVKQFKERYEQLLKKDTDGKITQAEKQQLRELKENARVYEEMAAQTKKRTVDDVVRDLTSRLRIVNAITATEKDVYVVTGEPKGYGYAVWRMDPEFKAAKQVMSGLRGCCGQMDIQARGDELFVAENCSHAVGRYTRDGQKLGTFGKRGQETEPACFGGCCNPMNVRVTADGSVYTAESEGHVKLFNAKGDFVCLVGTAKLQGGCKNVAVAASPDGEKVYFCDQPGSRILVLAKKAAKAE